MIEKLSGKLQERVSIFLFIQLNTSMVTGGFIIKLNNDPFGFVNK